MTNKTYDDVYNEALALLKADNGEHDFYYHIPDGKFVSLYHGELDDYIEKLDEYDEPDDYLDDILDSGDYIRVPELGDDLEKFQRNFAFTMDFHHVFYLEAPIETVKDIYEFAYRIYKCNPFKYFRDVDYIKNDLSAEELEDGYFVILGKAGKVYGLSVYIGEEGLESINGICDKENSTGDAFQAFAFTQKCLTIYFDKPNISTLENKVLTTNALGKEKASDVTLSTLVFTGRSAISNSISYSSGIIYATYLEGFAHFMEKYKEDGYKYPSFDVGEHIVYKYNEKNHKITYRKKYLDEPMYDISSDFLYSIPMADGRKKNSKTYEFKFLTADNAFHDDQGLFSFYAPIAVMINHKTGKIVALNVVLSDTDDYLEKLFDPLIDKINEEGLPKIVLVDSYLDFMIANRLFTDRVEVEFGDLKNINSIKEELTNSSDVEDEIQA